MLIRACGDAIAEPVVCWRRQTAMIDLHHSLGSSAAIIEPCSLVLIRSVHCVHNVLQNEHQHLPQCGGCKCTSSALFTLLIPA